jgi:glycosyltransferase involved in cell wall biosynthesis
MTLTTFKNQTYKNFEVIIYDDNSDIEHSLDDIINNYDFNIILIKRGDEPKKNAPSRGYNLASQKASGDILIIQNPECAYVQNDLLEYVNNNITDTNYLVFSCFNVTTKLTTDRLKNVIDENRLNSDLRFYANIHRKCEWYQHSIYKPVGLHFTCGIMKKNYEKMGGFDERYGDGIDNDDSDFIQRIKLFLNVQMIDNYNVIHLYHEKFRYLGDKNELERLRKINWGYYSTLMNEIKDGRTDPKC